LEKTSGILLKLSKTKKRKQVVERYVTQNWKKFIYVLVHKNNWAFAQIRQNKTYKQVKQ
jgi:hypothetical protein